MIGSLKNPSIETELYASGLYASGSPKRTNSQDNGPVLLIKGASKTRGRGRGRNAVLRLGLGLALG